MNKDEENNSDFTMHPEGLSHSNRTIVNRSFARGQPLDQAQFVASILDTLSNTSSALNNITDRLNLSEESNTVLRGTISSQHQSLEAERSRYKDERDKQTRDFEDLKRQLSNESTSHKSTKENLESAMLEVASLKKQIEELKNKKNVISRIINAIRE